MPDPTPTPAPTPAPAPSPTPAAGGGLSFFDPKTGVTYVGLGAIGTVAAGAVSSNTSWNSLWIAVGIGAFLGVIYMLINNFGPSETLRGAQQLGYGLLNCLVLIFVVFGGMAAVDKTTDNDTTQLKTEDAVTSQPPAPPKGELPPANNPGQVPPAPGTAG